MIWCITALTSVTNLIILLKLKYSAMQRACHEGIKSCCTNLKSCALRLLFGSSFRRTAILSEETIVVNSAAPGNGGNRAVHFVKNFIGLSIEAVSLLFITKCIHILWSDDLDAGVIGHLIQLSAVFTSLVWITLFIYWTVRY